MIRTVLTLAAICCPPCDVSRVATAGGAPAPLKREARRNTAPGHVLLIWHGSEWDATFSSTGSYRATSRSSQIVYVGTWKWEGGRLHVSEKPDAGVGTAGHAIPEIHWSASVGGDAETRVESAPNERR